jgi:hypothetical protein
MFAFYILMQVCILTVYSYYILDIVPVAGTIIWYNIHIVHILNGWGYPSDL